MIDPDTVNGATLGLGVLGAKIEEEEKNKLKEENQEGTLPCGFYISSCL